MSVKSILPLVVLSLFIFGLMGSGAAQSVVDLLPAGINATGSYDDAEFSVAWYLDTNQSEILFVYRGQTTGWVGIGWGNKPQMIGSDMIVSSVDANNVTTMTDRNTFGFSTQSTPNNDGPTRQNFQLHWGYVSQGNTYLSFSRPFVTGDTRGDLDILNTRYMLYALGPDGDLIVNDQFNQHPFPGTPVLINWGSNSTGTISTARDFTLVAVHAGLEIFGVAFLLVLGMWIPQFLKKALGKKIWLPLHVLCQFSGAALAFAGLGLAIAYVESNENSSVTNTAHIVLGSITLGFIGVTFLLGLVLSFLKKGDDNTLRKGMKHFHPYSAYLTILIGFVAIWLGMDALDSEPESTGTPTASWVLYSIWAGISIFLFVVLYFLKKKVPKPGLLAAWGFMVILGLGLLLPTAILIGDTESEFGKTY